MIEIKCFVFTSNPNLLIFVQPENLTNIIWDVNPLPATVASEGIFFGVPGSPTKCNNPGVDSQNASPIYIPNAPCDWYIELYEWDQCR